VIDVTNWAAKPVAKYRAATLRGPIPSFVGNANMCHNHVDD